MEIFVIIPAGGTNTRYSTTESKLLKKINNISILEHSISAFLNHPSIQQIIIPCHEANQLSKTSAFFEHPNIKFIDGGQSRAESVKKGYQEIPSTCSHVLIHDAARPNIHPSLIDNIINQCTNHDAIIPGVPVTDTIKRVNGNTISETLDRNELIHVQTPQCFSKSLLDKMYREITDIHQFTDESSIAESLNIPIHVISGNKSNIKLTVPEDFDYLSLLMS